MQSVVATQYAGNKHTWSSFTYHILGIVYKWYTGRSVVSFILFMTSHLGRHNKYLHMAFGWPNQRPNIICYSYLLVMILSK